MKNVAVNFESEWMDDGSLRLRFLDHDNHILGQQVVGKGAQWALETLLFLTRCQASEIAPEKVWEVFSECHIGIDLPTITALLESRRLRSGLTPEDEIRVNTVAEE